MDHLACGTRYAAHYLIHDAAFSSLRRGGEGACDPSIKIRQRPSAERAFLGDGLGAAAQPRAPRVFVRKASQRREQAEIDVHRLKRARPGIDRLKMSARDMRQQCAVRRRRGRWHSEFAAALGSRETAGEQTYSRGFNISFAAGDLSGKAQARIGLQPELMIQEFGRVQKGIAMQ